MNDLTKLEVRTYRPGDEREICEMFEQVFERPRTSESWKWKYLETPGGPGIVHLLEADKDLVGHMGHVRAQAWIDGRRVGVVQGEDTMVIPDYRARGGIQLLIQTFLAARDGMELRVSFPTDRSGRLFEHLGLGRVVGRIPRWTRWRRRGARRRAPIRIALTAGLRTHSAFASAPRPSLTVEPMPELGTEVDELSDVSAEFARCIRVRDAEFLRWRWLEQPGRSWTVRGARSSSGELRGLIVFGIASFGDGRTGSVVDLLAVDASALRALLIDSYETLTAQGCDRVMVEYQDPRPWARRALYRSGFLPDGTGSNVLVGSISPDLDGQYDTLDCWYMTAGDRDFA